MAESTGSAELFTRFALGLYNAEGIADACLALQNRHAVDVNVVLFAAFVGATRRRSLTSRDLDAAQRRVDAWHREIVRPLRALRQRLSTGPAPAPNAITADLRSKIKKLEIEAEVIELDELGGVVPHVSANRGSADAVECAAASIATVVRHHSETALDDADYRAIDTIAAVATQHVAHGPGLLDG
jgi:uncharacterized protein (TIGR02444 family)